jgi:hypothetical protein
MRNLNADYNYCFHLRDIAGSEIYRTLVQEKRIAEPQTYQDWLKVK